MAGAKEVITLKVEPGWRSVSVARFKERLTSLVPRPPLMAFTSPVAWSMRTKEICGWRT